MSILHASASPWLPGQATVTMFCTLMAACDVQKVNAAMFAAMHDKQHPAAIKVADIQLPALVARCFSCLQPLLPT
jgi:hypothetical protein